MFIILEDKPFVVTKYRHKPGKIYGIFDMENKQNDDKVERQTTANCMPSII